MQQHNTALKQAAMDLGAALAKSGVLSRGDVSKEVTGQMSNAVINALSEEAKQGEGANNEAANDANKGAANKDSYEVDSRRQRSESREKNVNAQAGTQSEQKVQQAQQVLRDVGESFSEEEKKSNPGYEAVAEASKGTAAKLAEMQNQKEITPEERVQEQADSAQKQSMIETRRHKGRPEATQETDVPQLFSRFADQVKSAAETGLMGQLSQAAFKGKDQGQGKGGPGM